MYLVFITLLFSLALGPDLKLLNAQTVNDVMSTSSLQSAPSSQGAEPNPLTTTQETTMRNETSTMGAHTTKATNVEGTSGTPTRTLPTTPELLLTTEPPPSPAPTIMTTYNLSTSAAPLEFTSKPEQEEENTTLIISFTTEPPQTASPSPALPDAPPITTKPSVPTSSFTEEMETTDTSPATTPLPPTTAILTTTAPTTSITPTAPTIPTTTSIPTTTTTTEEHTTPMTLFSTISTHSEGIISTTNSTAGKSPGEVISSRDGTDHKKGTNWLVVGIIALVLFCILMTLCVIVVFIRRRKQSGKQNFGYMNGQRSKKRKGAEDDVWAGPVKLGGGDCESPEEVDIQGQEKTDGVEATGLSTFTTLEENGGVGRPGSPEAKNWEEKEPLLYIDEEGKEKAKEEGKSDDAEAKEGVGEKDGKEAEPVREETFCLTTAV